jgi:hypothetical protein
MTVPGPGLLHRFHWQRAFAIGILVLILVLSLYTWFVLNWSYSMGYRSGLLQKFSQKGWVCKTYEGELWQSVVTNVAPTIWQFTVRRPEVAHQMDSLVGREVRLHYSEHRGIPTTCFGDTRYFVDSVTAVAGPSQTVGPGR